MKQRLRSNFLLGVCVGLVIAMGGVMITTNAQLSDEEKMERDESWAKLEFLVGDIPPDTESPNWRFLSDDVGLIVYSREQGVNKARLFMRIEFQGQEQWAPLAIDDGKNKSLPEFMLVEPPNR